MSTPAPSPAPRPAGRDDALRTRAGRLLLWQSAALLGMIGAFSLVLPWKMLAAVLALVAIVLGVRLWGLARRDKDVRPLSLAASFGMALALFGLTVSALPLLAWDETVRLEQCTASSVTARAQQACTTEFTRSVESRTGLPQLGG